MKIRIILVHLLSKKEFTKDFANIFEAKASCEDLLKEMKIPAKRFAWNEKIFFNKSKFDYIMFVKEQ